MKKIVICPNKFMMLIMAVSSMEIIWCVYLKYACVLWKWDLLSMILH
jgi:hypothetical protein